MRRYVRNDEKKNRENTFKKQEIEKKRFQEVRNAIKPSTIANFAHQRYYDAEDYGA